MNMSAQRTFEFKKSYEEVNIAGETFKVSMKDSDRKRYGEQIAKVEGYVKEVEATKGKDITIAESQVLEDKAKAVVLESLDVFFGEGSGDKLYAMSDEQTEELLPLVWVVAELISERHEEKINKYLNKSKKNKK